MFVFHLEKLTRILLQAIVDLTGGSIVWHDVPKSITGHNNEILVPVQFETNNFRFTDDELFEIGVANRPRYSDLTLHSKDTLQLEYLSSGLDYTISFALQYKKNILI